MFVCLICSSFQNMPSSSHILSCLNLYSDLLLGLWMNHQIHKAARVATCRDSESFDSSISQTLHGWRSCCLVRSSFYFVIENLCLCPFWIIFTSFGPWFAGTLLIWWYFLLTRNCQVCLFVHTFPFVCFSIVFHCVCVCVLCFIV